MIARKPAMLAPVAAALLLTASALGQPCPDGAEIEPEDCGFNKNDGCVQGPVWWDAACGQTWCGTAWATGGMRDTDWYELTLPDPDGDGLEPLIATVVSELPLVTFIIDDGCFPVIVATGCAEGGETLQVAHANLAPGDYIVFAAAGTCEGAVFDGFPCAGDENLYLLTIGCASPPPCPADLDGNGAVDVDDLVQLVLEWGFCGFQAPCPSDLNGDAHVGVDDLVLLILAWGSCV